MQGRVRFWVIGSVVLAAVLAVSVILWMRFAPDRNQIRDRLLAEARSNYRYAGERPPVDESGGQGPKIPELTIAGAERLDDTNRPRAHRFVGRIRSADRYSKLGIAPGPNYLWTDSVKTWDGDTGQVRVLIVPENRAFPMVWLKIDSIHARMRSMQTSTVFIPTAWRGAQTVEISSTNPMLRLTSSTLLACSDGCSSGHCASDEILRAYEPGIDDGTMVIP